MAQFYKTVEPGIVYAGEYTEKKSRFIAALTGVGDLASAREFINGIKKKYYDARHNVTTCEITGNSTVDRTATGPFYPDDPYSLGKYILGEDGNVHKTSSVTVSDNAKTFNNFVLLDHLWLSKTVSTYAIVGIKLQYADGTEETVNPNSVIKNGV